MNYKEMFPILQKKVINKFLIFVFMTKEQLDNIIFFRFLFQESELSKYDPTYICEKFSSCISSNDEDLILYNSVTSPLSKYEKMWGNFTDNKIYTKVLLIYELNNLSSYSLENILNIFERYINLDNINLYRYNHIHPVLVSHIEEWLEMDINKTYYQSLLRDIAIASIID